MCVIDVSPAIDRVILNIVSSALSFYFIGILAEKIKIVPLIKLNLVSFNYGFF